MLPTPNLDHLSATDYEHVYEPAEDTFLLLDALEKDAILLKDQIKPCICLEIGSGSGCVSTFLGRLLGDGQAYINPYASEITLKTGFKNTVHLDAITTNLVSGLLPRLHHQIDVLCFNPPYVVTNSKDLSSRSIIDRAWAGGVDGREIINQIIPLVDDLLSPNGIFYLLVISENKPQDIRKIMLEKYNLQSEVLLSRLSGREKQMILKFHKNKV
ncbi:hypothetical protein G9A89_001886 [Geosiphon pyriformis]|nr:hypothetical protein G9A89_001886 [Geosiphon pyriformis]